MFFVERRKDRKRVPLNDCCELRADETLRNAAKRKFDAKNLALASSNLVTSEAKYHKPCYRDYTRPPSNSKSVTVDSSSTKSHCDIVENDGFRCVSDRVQKYIKEV